MDLSPPRYSTREMSSSCFALRIADGQRTAFKLQNLANSY